jgi:hypothetical protein
MSPNIRQVVRCTATMSVAAMLSACAPPAPPTVPTIQAAATQVAPTVQAAGTQVAPTVQAAQTAQGATVEAVKPTVQAMGTQLAATATAVAPTAQAVATQVAPTVQAAATQAVSAVGTSVATSPVQITSMQVDQVDTRIMIRNSGSNSVNLRNWTLLIGPKFAVTLSDIKLDANQTRTLHLAAGEETPTDVYLGHGSGVVSATFEPGDRVVLVSSGADVASIYRPI